MEIKENEFISEELSEMLKVALTERDRKDVTDLLGTSVNTLNSIIKRQRKVSKRYKQTIEAATRSAIKKSNEVGKSLQKFISN